MPGPALVGAPLPPLPAFPLPSAPACRAQWPESARLMQAPPASPRRLEGATRVQVQDALENAIGLTYGLLSGDHLSRRAVQDVLDELRAANQLLTG